MYIILVVCVLLCTDTSCVRFCALFYALRTFFCVVLVQCYYKDKYKYSIYSYFCNTEGVEQIDSNCANLDVEFT